MPERIPELDRLAAEAQEVSMLPPSEIRRLGNRRRTTRTVAVTAAITVVALAAGFGIWQSPLMDQARDPQWATTAEPEIPDPSAEPTPVESETPTAGPTPEPTQTPTEIDEPTVDPSQTGSAEAPPSWDNAPTAEMLFPDISPDLPPAEIKNQYEGLGQAAKGLCDPGEYGGPSVTLTREYGYPDSPAYMDAVTFGYDSIEAATKGFDLIRDAALQCGPAMEERAGLTDPGVYDATEDVPFDPSIVDADPVRMAYATYAGLIPDSDYGLFGQTVVLQAGDRVLWLNQVHEGQDDNCAPGPDDEHIMQCFLPAAIPQALKALDS